MTRSMVSTALIEYLVDAAAEDVLKITLEQLRLIYFLEKLGSISQVAKYLGKDQSSIQKSLNSLNGHLRTTLRQDIVLKKQQRGRDELTASGKLAHQFAADVLEAAQRLAIAGDASDNYVVRVGLTTFLMHYFYQIRQRLKRYPRQYNSRLIHLRTGNLEQSVLKGEVDCAFGGKAVLKDGPVCFLPGLRARVIQEDRFGFMLNQGSASTQLTFADVVAQKIPIVLPTTGVIYEFVMSQLGERRPEGVEKHLNVREWCDDVHFAFEIMRFESDQVGMFVLKGVYGRYAQHFEAAGTPHKSKFFDLPDANLKVCVAFLVNEEFVDSLSAQHPLTRFIKEVDQWIIDA